MCYARKYPFHPRRVIADSKDLGVLFIDWYRVVNKKLAQMVYLSCFMHLSTVLAIRNICKYYKTFSGSHSVSKTSDLWN